MISFLGKKGCEAFVIWVFGWGHIRFIVLDFVLRSSTSLQPTQAALLQIHIYLLSASRIHNMRHAVLR